MEMLESGKCCLPVFLLLIETIPLPPSYQSLLCFWEHPWKGGGETCSGPADICRPERGFLPRDPFLENPSGNYSEPILNPHAQSKQISTSLVTWIPHPRLGKQFLGQVFHLQNPSDHRWDKQPHGLARCQRRRVCFFFFFF